MTTTNKFLKSVKAHRESKSAEKFHGVLGDYLKLLEKNPDISILAHKRLYKQIMSTGMRTLDETDARCNKLFNGEPVRIYDYFSSQFFGMERPLEKVMRFLRSASMKGEESRQVLLLLGPVGAGKSALIEHIKGALEACNPIYVLKDCPIREEPLHLIPRSLRDEFSEMYNIKIEGDLCPLCRHRLINEYDGDYTRFPITQAGFSVRGRKGVGVVPPMDPNTQDTGLLIGSEDISKLDLYPEDDPRALSLNGAFNVGNRGIVEFVEVFKNEIEFLHTMITATQEKNVPSPGKQAMIYFDGVILAHCNEAEWNKFKSEHTNEAILDRIVRVNVPYTLEFEQEVKIYEKLIARSDFNYHIAPHTLEIAAMFAVLSRLKPSAKVDPLTKMKIYNGEEIVESGLIKKVDIKDLREEVEDEGMTGISTRFVMKAIDAALSDSTKNMITPISIRDALIKQVKEQITSADTRAHCLQFLQKTLHEEYLAILEKEITKAFVTAYEEQAESLFNNYLDHAEAYVNNTRVKDNITNEDMEPDERFLQSIEEQIGIKGSSKNNFRADITSYMFAKLRRGETIDWRSYGPLREAVESKLVASVRDISRIVTKSKSRDTKQKKKFNAMVQTLIEDYDYNEASAEEVLKFASNNLWRDS
ncbi:MAG: serine protein kinase [Parcubacteria group bacterium]|nr:serine protein kinase [Parcubacteria group bacterium]|tara:strand:+ start:6475 stop:8409 length:1935 start_codon:yes stop_codon:yes gene_type:complete